jgi:NYN domain
MGERRPSRTVVLLDCGYLFAAAGDGARLTDLAGFVARLRGIGGEDVLRTYWYEADGPWTEGRQREIAAMTDVKLRHARHPRSISTLMSLDLARLAFNEAIDGACIVSGDEDLVEAVTLIQEFGIRVTVVDLPTSRLGERAALGRAADVRDRLTSDELREYFTQVSRLGADEAMPRERSTPPLGEAERDIVTRLIGEFTEEQRVVIEHGDHVSSVFDRALVRLLSDHLGERVPRETLVAARRFAADSYVRPET